MNSAEKRNLLHALRKIHLTGEQKEAIRTINQSPITVLRGLPGTAKTFTAIYAALQLLAESKIESLALTRPLVTTENIGILPGDIDDKFDPYLYPISSIMHDTLHIDFDKYVMSKVIRKAPLAFMRGQTVAHEVLIIDEAQNVTSEQMLMALTRIGNNGKIIIAGDEDQSDLRLVESGLDKAVALSHRIPEVVSTVRMEKNMRSEVISLIVDNW